MRQYSHILLLYALFAQSDVLTSYPIDSKQLTTNHQLLLVGSNTSSPLVDDLQTKTTKKCSRLLAIHDDESVSSAIGHNHKSKSKSKHKSKHKHESRHKLDQNSNFTRTEDLDRTSKSSEPYSVENERISNIILKFAIGFAGALSALAIIGFVVGFIWTIVF